MAIADIPTRVATVQNDWHWSDAETFRANYESMAESAWQLIHEGHTNLEELIRMLPYQVTVDFRHRRFGNHEPLPMRIAKTAVARELREAVPALQ